MKLKQVTIENFRGFKQKAIIDVNDFTVLVGKNDAGKSTVMDALDVFFNSDKPDKDDVNVYTESDTIEIACIFSDLPESIIIDTSFETSIEGEFLLDSEGNLKIIKTYDLGKKTPLVSVECEAQYPTGDNYNDLHSLTNAKLKALAKKLNADTSEANLSVNAHLRRAIWDTAESIELSPKRIRIDNDKSVWKAIKDYLPLYAVFKSDRPSTDQDSEAQDPMNQAIKEAVSSQEVELNKLTSELIAKVKEVAKTTVNKLNEISPELAKDLDPDVSNKPWHSLFKISLTGDENVSINKRGSGFRRLLLLSFFRAKAESEAEGRNVIYGIEEPETSQHPNNQKMILDALQELVDTHNVQAIITTHTPVLASHVDHSNLRFVERTIDGPVVRNVDDSIFEEISRTLGILPDHNVKAFFGVEGPNDISFLKIISSVLNKENPDIPDLSKCEDNGELVFIPMGGSTLGQWVSRMNGLKRPEFYLMDRDNEPPLEPKYQKFYNQMINDGHTAWITKKKELENYIDSSLIKEKYQNYDGSNHNFEDVPQLLAKAIHENSGSQKPWNEVIVNKESLKKKTGNAKKMLNKQIVSEMSMDRMQRVDPHGELIGWLKAIGEVLH